MMGGRVARWRGWCMVVFAVVANACEVDSAGPRWVADLRLQPDSVHAEPGQTVTISAIPIDQRGEHLEEFATLVEWTMESGNVASLDTVAGVATVVAGGVGTARIKAALGRAEELVPVYVHPSGLEEIQIDPASLELALGPFVTVTAVLLDAAGKRVGPGGFRISWMVVDESVADLASVGPTIGETARIRGIAVGQTAIRLTVGGRTVTAPVQVR